jgi:hypothetical protein
MNTEAYRQSARERKKIETRFGDVKRNLGFTRLRLRGLIGARDEFLLAETAQNLRSLATFGRLIDSKKSKFHYPSPPSAAASDDSEIEMSALIMSGHQKPPLQRVLQQPRGSTDVPAAVTNVLYAKFGRSPLSTPSAPRSIESR